MVTSRMRAKDDSPSSIMWSPNRSLTCPTGSFLTVGLPPSSRYLASCLSGGSTYALVSQLGDHRLMH